MLWVYQEEVMGTAQATAHGLLLQGEAFRLALVKAGTDYRTLFAWLLTTIRSLNEDGVPNPQRPNRFQHEPLRISAFLQRQFTVDTIGSQLTTEVLFSIVACMHSSLYAVLWASASVQVVKWPTPWAGATGSRRGSTPDE